jgi:hypothetical protein
MTLGEHTCYHHLSSLFGRSWRTDITVGRGAKHGPASAYLLDDLQRGARLRFPPSFPFPAMLAALALFGVPFLSGVNAANNWDVACKGECSYDIPDPAVSASLEIVRVTFAAIA